VIATEAMLLPIVEALSVVLAEPTVVFMMDSEVMFVAELLLAVSAGGDCNDYGTLVVVVVIMFRLLLEADNFARVGVDDLSHFDGWEER
jgi:hypothetical protein